jgi:NADH:ubiquinone oxidoreductase subunit E
MGKKKKKKPVISVCTGSACKKEKAEKLYKRVKAGIRDRGLKGTVKAETCSCLGDCKNAPIAEVAPGGKTLKKVNPKKADDLIDAAAGAAGKRETNRRIP